VPFSYSNVMLRVMYGTSYCNVKNDNNKVFIDLTCLPPLYDLRCIPEIGKRKKENRDPYGTRIYSLYLPLQLEHTLILGCPRVTLLSL
jgi:hypothetical protein